jgi:hypothetical protein
MNFKIYVTHSQEDYIKANIPLRLPEIEIKILNDQRLPFEIIYDKDTALRLSKGRLNPVSDWVIESPKGDIIYSYFSLCDYIDKHGLRLC